MSCTKLPCTPYGCTPVDCAAPAYGCRWVGAAYSPAGCNSNYNSFPAYGTTDCCMATCGTLQCDTAPPTAAPTEKVLPCPQLICTPPQKPGCSYVDAVYEPAGCNDAQYAGATCCMVSCATQDCTTPCPLLSCPQPQPGCSYVGAVYSPAGCNDATYAGGGQCCQVSCGTQDCPYVDQCADAGCDTYGFTDTNGVAIASCAFMGDCMPHAAQGSYQGLISVVDQTACEAQHGQWCPAPSPY